ncbi:MarR family winged helix-turn-helix transcriptional regulator [Croceibacterium selenioxidans]|nr:MarR family transcriptional regulator [Croceibacterium selenioxidans]
MTQLIMKAMAVELGEADYVALADIRYSIREFLAFSEKKAADCGLTPQQHQALLAIRAAPVGAATVGYVAERLILKPHSATGLVDRLEALGLVSRQVSESDRRQSLLRLSDRAISILARLSVTHREEILRIRPLLVQLLSNLEHR